MTREEAAEFDEDMLFADGFDDCLMGVTHIWTGHSQETVALYDYNKMVAKLVADGMSSEEADEYLSFNTLGAYVGPKTPAYAVIR